MTKQLSGKYNKSSGETVKAKDDRIPTTENEEVLNRPEPEIIAENQDVKCISLKKNLQYILDK